MIGTTVGSYLVTEKVSVGGMGTVYKAEHTLLGKAAAVKVLHPELRNNREVVNRFFNEAKATTQIKHPGIVEVFDFGYLPSGDGYIIMEFLDGMSLAERLRTRGTMNEGEAAMLLRAVCSALSAAHAKKIIHRDLKPDNVFLCPDPDAALGERPKLLDFGIAKLTDASIGATSSATKTGAVMGTPTYMSPEQCRGTGDVDARSDLYSIGCMFYEMVCGVPPFVAEGAGELIGAHLFVEPQPPSTHDPKISAETDRLILQLLDKKADKRPQSAKELGQRLTVIAQQQNWISASTPSGITEIKARPAPMPAALSPTVASDPSITPVIPKPTTLSGAASQQQPVARPAGRGKLFAALGAFVVCAGAGVGYMATRTATAHDKTAPAAAPAPEAPAAAPPAPAPPPPAPVAVQPAPPPAPTPVPPPPPVEAKKEPPPPPAPQVEPKHTTKIVKTVTKTPPPATKATKATTTKPTTPPPGNGSGSAKPILIETDI